MIVIKQGLCYERLGREDCGHYPLSEISRTCKPLIFPGTPNVNRAIFFLHIKWISEHFFLQSRAVLQTYTKAKRRRKSTQVTWETWGWFAFGWIPSMQKGVQQYIPQKHSWNNILSDVDKSWLHNFNKLQWRSKPYFLYKHKIKDISCPKKVTI